MNCKSEDYFKIASYINVEDLSLLSSMEVVGYSKRK